MLDSCCGRGSCVSFVECRIRDRKSYFRVAQNESKIQNRDPLLMIHFVLYLIDVEKGLALSRGETHAAVHCSFINLMKLPNVETLTEPFHVLMSFF